MCCCASWVLLRRAISPADRRPLIALLVCCGLLNIVARPSQAQIVAGAAHTVPTDSYYAGFGALYDGEYKAALEIFGSELKGGMRTGQQRWIDSICYHTMVGEVYYHMGQYGDAKDNYDAALNIFITYHDWMLRGRFPDSIVPEAPGAIKGVPWGASRNGARYGHFPSNIMIAQGRLDNSEVIQKGGVVQAPVYVGVNIHEIVRCTTLALYRRQQIMGPICPHEKLSDEVVAALINGSALPNHWSNAWSDVQLGMAYAADGKTGQALPLLKRSLVLAGQFDHPLTSMAYLKIGQIALEAGDLDAAMVNFDEATYSAAHFGNMGVIEEAFHYGQVAWLMANKKGIYPPLPKATTWAKSHGKQLYALMLLLAAENYASQGEPQLAAPLLLEAKGQMFRREMAVRDIGARFNYVSGLVNYQKANTSAGDDALSAALAWERSANNSDKSPVDRPGSKWLYQIGMADNLYTRGAVPPRIAIELYSKLLRDPVPTDWGFDPLETLSVLSVPHVPAFEHWFEAVMQKKDNDLALEIADRTRRHRFYSTQQLGGRLLNLRWILESPIDSLDSEAKLQRADLLSKYTAYAKFSQDAKAIVTQVRRLPLAPETVESQREQAASLAELAKISLLQEAALREIAVRREPAKMVFPPLRSVQQIKAALPPKTLMLTFFSTSKQTYAFLLSNSNYASWQMTNTVQLEKSCVALLRAMGNVEKNRELALDKLTEKAWRQAGKDATTALLAGANNVDLSVGIDELIIVPDGFLWYLPFEALQVGQGANQKSLIEKTRIRYAPTMGLSVPDKLGRPQSPSVAVTLGKLYPRDDAAVSQNAFDLIKKVAPGAVALKGQIWTPTPLYSTLYDGLIALEDIDVRDDPYGWSPMPLDKTRSSGALSNWFPLPWGGPDVVMLPGFHTAAEDAIKRPGANGNEVFLAITGLMSTGARTILISRWRTGGATSIDLLRQFTQELPYATAADSWQRAVRLVSLQPIDPGAEPRIKLSANAAAPNADHPFFWSGYLLVDNGTLPQKAEAPARPPVLKFPPVPGKPAAPGNPPAVPPNPAIPPIVPLPAAIAPVPVPPAAIPPAAVPPVAVPPAPKGPAPDAVPAVRPVAGKEAGG